MMLVTGQKALIFASRTSQLTAFGIRKAWFDVGKDLKDEANKEMLKKPRQGRVYFIRTASGRRRRHVASRPFETHANLSGTLRRSMGWKVTGIELRFGYGLLNNDAPPYARAIEFGAKFKTHRLEKRPSLLNSIKANRRNSINHIKRHVGKSLNNVG